MGSYDSEARISGNALAGKSSFGFYLKVGMIILELVGRYIMYRTIAVVFFYKRRKDFILCSGVL